MHVTMEDQDGGASYLPEEKKTWKTGYCLHPPPTRYLNPTFDSLCLLQFYLSMRKIIDFAVEAFYRSEKKTGNKSDRAIEMLSTLHVKANSLPSCSAHGSPC